MRNHVDWWLVEVERRLSGHLTSDKLEAVLMEAEQHLRECTDETNLTTESSYEAVKRFGDPKRYSQEILRQYPSHTQTRSNFLAGGVQVIALLIPALALSQWPLSTVEWIVPNVLLLCGLTLLIESWRARKLFYVPCFLASLSVFLMLLPYCAATLTCTTDGKLIMSLRETPKAIAQYEVWARNSEADEAFLMSGREYYSRIPTGTSYNHRFQKGSQFLTITDDQVSASSGRLRPAYTYVQGFWEARAKWIQAEADVRRQLLSDRVTLTETRNQYLQNLSMSYTERLRALVLPSSIYCAIVFVYLLLMSLAGKLTRFIYDALSCLRQRRALA